MCDKKTDIRNRSIGLIVLLALLVAISIQVADAKKPTHSKSPSKTCQSDRKKNMDKITSFTYHQSGGFAAINRAYEVKLADLSKEDREKLEGLIAASGLLSMKNERKTTPGAADMFFYEFTAVNGREHRASYDDGTLPEAFRPLVDYVRDKAVR